MQGQDNWSYGYRNFTVDGGETNYDATDDFVAFAGGSENPAPFDGVTQQWRGLWDLKNPQNGAGAWTFLGREGTHPNGTNSSPLEEHWTIRRWTASELTGVTPLALTWHTRKTDLNASGVTGSLHINGVQVDTAAVAGADGVGVTRTWYANVSPGDIIDLALTPLGPGGETGDGSDGSANWLRVDSYIPPEPEQPGGTPFVPENGQGLRITAVVLDEGAGEVTVTWTSAQGVRYAVDTSTDLQPVWSEFEDTVFGEAGTETSYDVVLPQPIPKRFFVRVRQVPDS